MTFPSNFLVLQFINGLNLVSHNKTKIKRLKHDDSIILNEAMASLSSIIINKSIVSWVITLEVINQPSITSIFIGVFFNIKGIEWRLTIFLSMKFVDAPKSNNACIDIIKLL